MCHFVFFFQAEAVIRDYKVTGVQTCALPILAKLFLVDLGNTATIARVVSFLGVGLLLLVVGYFAPVPPRAETERSEERRVGREWRARGWRFYDRAKTRGARE